MTKEKGSGKQGKNLRTEHRKITIPNTRVEKVNAAFVFRPNQPAVK